MKRAPTGLGECGGLETPVLEPVGDVMFPFSATEDDMPLPDDVQLESFGFWRTLREQGGLYVARQRLYTTEKERQVNVRITRPELKTRPVFVYAETRK